MAGTIQMEQPRIEIEKKIGNTIYIVSGFYASNGVTASKKIERLLDKESKGKSC